MVGVGWRFGLATDAVEAIEIAEQHLRRIAGIGETVVGPRQILPGNRAHDVGRHQDHQLGALIDVVVALEQRTEDGKLPSSPESR